MICSPFQRQLLSGLTFQTVVDIPKPEISIDYCEPTVVKYDDILLCWHPNVMWEEKVDVTTIHRESI